MDGTLGSFVISGIVALCLIGVVGAGLRAWRWWLDDKAAEREGMERRDLARKAYDFAKLDALPGRIAALEEEIKGLRWAVKK